ncbi:MAG: hypothetical protein ACE5DO_05775 [Desulfobacterales bacterium]
MDSTVACYQMARTGYLVWCRVNKISWKNNEKADVNGIHKVSGYYREQARDDLDA